MVIVHTPAPPWWPWDQPRRLMHDEAEVAAAQRRVKIKRRLRVAGIPFHPDMAEDQLVLLAKMTIDKET